MKKFLGTVSAIALIAALSTAAGAAELDANHFVKVEQAEAISANVQFQDTDQTIETLDENIDGPYDGTMDFGNKTFKSQKIDSNNFNTGQNAAQQNGVALAIVVEGRQVGQGGGQGGGWATILNASNAVAVNYLDQVTVQTVKSTDEILNDSGSYTGKMKFGNESFKRQIGVANNFNTGMNAAQQGGVAIAASVPAAALFN